MALHPFAGRPYARAQQGELALLTQHVEAKVGILGIYLWSKLDEHAEDRQAGMQKVLGMQCCPLEPAGQLWRVLFQVSQRNPACTLRHSQMPHMSAAMHLKLYGFNINR